jgi:hypothetical protein
MTRAVFSVDSVGQEEPLYDLGNQRRSTGKQEADEGHEKFIFLLSFLFSCRNDFVFSAQRSVITEKILEKPVVPKQNRPEPVRFRAVFDFD